MWNLMINQMQDGTVIVKHDGNFVVRFKHANPKRSANHFVKFLKVNFTVEKYFTELKTGMAPLTILKTKGFESYNVLQAQKLNKLAHNM